MDGIYILFCLAMIVFLAAVALVIVILKSDNKKESRLIHSPQIHLERSREFMERYDAPEAKKHALEAFRSGDRAIRLQAIKLLSALHEVEEF
jgi:hypothetical protein